MVSSGSTFAVTDIEAEEAKPLRWHTMPYSYGTPINEKLFHGNLNLQN